MVPCAQGRVVVETARPAAPYFATCSGYRRQTTIVSTPIEIATRVSRTTSSSATQTDQQSMSSSGKGAMIPTHGSAARPEDLGVTPWYLEDYPTIDSSPGPTGDRGSYPSYSRFDTDIGVRLDETSTKNSSFESEIPRPPVSAVPRKAYMDLRDAIALLDETCPNQEPSPSLTPRTPRTPVTPHPRNKRARSKSSDNSSNYSNDRLNERSFENPRPQDKEKKRPFLKKIGISKTEDKPFLAKLAPRIIGKPYLEKIGPSKAIEKPFLDKIGSSKTLDKFIFDTPRYERNDAKNETAKDETKKNTESKKLEKQQTQKVTKIEQSFGVERRRSGKGTLLKMYSFETEDLESTVQTKDHRDPLRGVSLDDVLDSGPSSLPLETITDESPKPDTKERTANGVELLKCRVTTSEEIIFSSTSFGSDKEPSSWGNSPRERWLSRKDKGTPQTSTRSKLTESSPRSDESVPNSPTKRPISSVLPDRPNHLQKADTSERNVYSPIKTRRQTYEDLLNRYENNEEETFNHKQAQFERRGISSDNLLSKDRSLIASIYQGDSQVEKTREVSSEDSLAHRTAQEYTKETFKQLQDKFKYHEIPTETYADFKRRTRAGNVQGIISRQYERLRANNAESKSRNESSKESSSKAEQTARMDTDSTKDERSESGQVQRSTTRFVLKKQQGIDHQNDQEWDTNASIRRPKRRIFHEPSQETMDLLTELRKVKSLLKTPSWEKDLDLDKKPVRQPKRILLTDKEFCLSVERENSIRRPSRVISSLERTEEGQLDGRLEDDRKEVEGLKHENESREQDTPGPALFEKKCLSLDYADDEKPQKPEARTISLASARNFPSELEETIDYSDIGLICESRSCSSDVFNTPSTETNEKERGGDEPDSKDIARSTGQNHCAEVDIAIPIDQKASSPKIRAQIQGRTSDLYEIISPRSTPFRAKKRLGKISVEETVKPESFTLGSKVDCRSTVTQKRAKCFPL